MFFFLVQTEQGDIFKVTMETDEDMVKEVKLKYFDTVPVASSMCVLKTGFLFVASEFGNQYVKITFSCLTFIFCMMVMSTVFHLSFRTLIIIFDADLI